MTKASGSIDLNSLKVAGEPNKYVTYINDEGVRVHEANDESNYSLINATGMSVFQNNKSIATFGSNTLLGSDESARLELVPEGIKAYGANGAPYFTMNSEGTAETITVTQRGPQNSTGTFNINHPIVYGPINLNEQFSNYSELTTGQSFIIQIRFTAWFTRNNRPQSDEYIIDCTFTKGTNKTWETTTEYKNFNFQYQPSINNNLTINITCEDGSYYATSLYPYLKFNKQVALPIYAFGLNMPENTNALSVSMNEGTQAGARGLAIGKYNTVLNYPFIIGNGTGDTSSAHSNALTVDWNGNIIAQGMAGQIIMTGCPAGGPGSSTLVPANNTTIYEPIPGWLICNGAAVSRTTYATLFAVIGTTYGTGNGSTTFNLPDFRGRVGVGGGTSTATGATNHTLNQKAGEETHVLTPGETAMKSHDHVIKYNVVDWKNGTGTSKSCRNVVASGSSSASTENTTAADGSAHNNMQPYIGINYIICTGKTS